MDAVMQIAEWTKIENWLLNSQLLCYNSRDQDYFSDTRVFVYSWISSKNLFKYGFLEAIQK